MDTTEKDHDKLKESTPVANTKQSVQVVPEEAQPRVALCPPLDREVLPPQMYPPPVSNEDRVGDSQINNHTKRVASQLKIV